MSRLRFLLWSGGLCLCFLFVFSLSVSYGTVPLEWEAVWKVILHHLSGGSLYAKVDAVQDAIVWRLRVPRALFAAMVGALLAISGVILQGLLKNPLADPYILGVSSGASVGAVAAMLMSGNLLWLGIWQIPTFAFLGSCLALLLVFYLADRQLKTESLILAGVIVNAFFGAWLTFAISLSPQKIPQIQYWLMGSFSLKEWDYLWVLFPSFVLCFTFAWLYSRELNLLLMGERRASHLGMSVKGVRRFLLIVASFMTAVSVSVAGMIGFVGLIVPHVMRFLTGANHRTLLPLSAVIGAIFLLLSDWIARLVLAPQELPVGVITAFVGAPFFAWIFKGKQR